MLADIKWSLNRLSPASKKNLWRGAGVTAFFAAWAYLIHISLEDARSHPRYQELFGEEKTLSQAVTELLPAARQAQAGPAEGKRGAPEKVVWARRHGGGG